MSADARRMARMPVPGEIWAHHKGQLYTIVGIGHDTRDGDAVVIYQTKGWGPDAKLWCRPLGEFLGYTQGHEKRFAHLSEEERAA